AATPSYDDGGARGGSGGSGGGGGSAAPMGLPVPPGPSDVPRPAGTPGNLKVLHWAGFKSAVSYTFDDAQPSQIEHYPDLQAAGEGDTVARFNTQIDGAESGGRWLIFLIHTITPTSQSWYAPIDVSVVTDSIAHAKSLNDVWIDSMVNVGAYWRGEKVATPATPATSGGAQTWTWTRPDHFPPGKILRVTVDGGTPSQNGKPL